MNKPQNFDHLMDQFVNKMQAKLGNEGVNVKADVLKKVLAETEQDVKAGCDQCANGWHW